MLCLTRLFSLALLLKSNKCIASPPFPTGGHALQYSLGGLQLRTTSIPSQSFTFYQQLQKSIFKYVQSIWREISVACQTAWHARAASTVFYDYCGNPYYLEGLQLFQKFNYSRLLAGMPYFECPPTSDFVKNWFGFVVPFSSVSNIIFTVMVEPIPPDTSLFIYSASPSTYPISENFEKYHVLDIYKYPMLQSVSLTSVLISKFGQLTPGLFLNIAARLYTHTSGLFGSTFFKHPVLTS